MLLFFQGVDVKSTTGDLLGPTSQVDLCSAYPSIWRVQESIRTKQHTLDLY